MNKTRDFGLEPKNPIWDLKGDFWRKEHNIDVRFMHSLGKEINKITYLHFLFKYPPCPSPEKSIISRFSWKLHGLRKKKQGNIFSRLRYCQQKKEIFTNGSERGAMVIFKTTIGKVKRRESNEPFQWLYALVSWLEIKEK